MFGPENLPYGVYARPGQRPRVGVRYGDGVLDVGTLAARAARREADALGAPSLDAFLALGPTAWRESRRWLQDVVTADRSAGHLVPLDEVTLRQPFAVADYVDFYASEHHASALGAMFRPGSPPLPPNWRHLPIGYHGRAGTVVVSGTPVVRPCGQRRPDPDAPPVFGPTERLDVEAEVGFVVGVPTRLGERVPVADFPDHVFGVCLVNDWSARDVQAWEYVPLGPFLGKSFATSVSPWVVPLDALVAARVEPPPRDPPPLPYLADVAGEPWGLDLTLELRLNGELLARPPYASTYWTPAQMLAHLTANGAALRTGDLYASGTVSGPGLDQRGSLIELTANGSAPLRLADGSTRGFLRDGDEVTITATAPGPGGTVIGLGAVTGRVAPATC